MEDSIGALAGYRGLDGGGVEGGYGGFIIGGEEYPIGEVGGNHGEGVGLEGFTNGAGARGG